MGLIGARCCTQSIVIPDRSRKKKNIVFSSQTLKGRIINTPLHHMCDIEFGLGDMRNYDEIYSESIFNIVFVSLTEMLLCRTMSSMIAAKHCDVLRESRLERVAILAR